MSRTATQLRTIVDSFRDWGRVDAHEMLRHGITRTATYIWTLRHRYGWDITTSRTEGEMATYFLRNGATVNFEAPFNRERPQPRCNTCGEPATEPLTRVSPSFSRGLCTACGKNRMFRVTR